MITKKQLLTIFIPALFIVGLALFVRISQYDPLYPKEVEKTDEEITAIIPIFPGEPILGNKKATITLIAFEDLGCESCAYQSSLLEELLVKHPGKVKIIWKPLTVTRFPISTERAHAYAICANEQEKFPEFQKIAFTNGQNLNEDILKLISEEIELNQKKLDKCLVSGMPTQLAEQVELVATILNIQAVPAFFLNNKQIITPQNLEEWELALGI